LDDNIRKDPGKTGWEFVDLIHVAEVMDQWLALVNTLMNFPVPWKVGKFLSFERSLDFQDALFSMGLVS
jgi:hypothetical protein